MKGNVPVLKLSEHLLPWLMNLEVVQVRLHVVYHSSGKDTMEGKGKEKP